MPRPHRIEYPGAWHHVMNRRAARETLFSDDVDRFAFLDLLAEGADLFKVEVHAYCLMGNHYHLLLRTPEANLAEMMQRVASRFARKFNDRYYRDGAVCRGRYRSVLVDSERYLLAVSRYIHRNPLAFWHSDLSSYGWSSYPAYLGLRRPQEWLSTSTTLQVIGGRGRYRSLVESPLPSEVDSLYERTNLPAVLGSRSFRAKAEQRAKPAKGSDPFS